MERLRSQVELWYRPMAKPEWSPRPKLARSEPRRYTTNNKAETITPATPISGLDELSHPRLGRAGAVDITALMGVTNHRFKFHKRRPLFIRSHIFAQPKVQPRFVLARR